jgi:hypothetical protein
MELSSLLPDSKGLLPYWLLLVRQKTLSQLKLTSEIKASTAASANCVQAYLTTSYVARVYLTNPEPTTRLQARTFGSWTFLSAIVRIYSAYHLSEPAFYQLCLWTFVIAWAHFTSEWLYFKTAKWKEGLAGPIIVANVSLVWMLWCWDDYVQ